MTAMSKHHLAALVAVVLASLAATTRADDFPSNRELAEQNVVLTVSGYVFGGGVVKDKGNGFEVVPQGMGGQRNCGQSRWHPGDELSRRGSRAIEMTATFDAMASKGGATYQVPFIKAYDRVNDLAILKIQGAKNFDSARLGDSDDAEPRDPVLAVGNPRGMGINITEGKISSINTNRRTGKPYRLVHTAPITTGNSGGSLYRGSKIIGVNHAEMTGGGEFAFAVPVNLVKTVLGSKAAKSQALLTDVFMPDPNNVMKKRKQVFATTASVPPRPAPQRNGVWAKKLTLLPRSDYVVILNTGDDVNMDLRMWAGGKMIGLGADAAKGFEALAISNEYAREVQLEVHSGWSVPKPFGIEVSRIVW